MSGSAAEENSVRRRRPALALAAVVAALVVAAVVALTVTGDDRSISGTDESAAGPTETASVPTEPVRSTLDGGPDDSDRGAMSNALSYRPSDFVQPEESPPEQSSAPYGEGAFRISCRGGHLNYDDPIVFPGEPGRSHLHQYFGNDAIDAFTTADDIESSGDSTCHGGPINRSGYWVPALIDRESGDVVPIDIAIVYYKGEPAGVASPLLDDVSPLPEGLAVVTDDYDWLCDGEKSKVIPAGCGSLGLTIRFGWCWNGSVTAPDHRSHVVFPSRDTESGHLFCPDTHPVVIPRITYNVTYDLSSSSGTENLHLSSDLDPAMAQPAQSGTTAHGDYLEGWSVIDEESGRTGDDLWWSECLIGYQDASSGRLCDGRQLTWPAAGQRQAATPVPPVPETQGSVGDGGS